jgi:MFS family permease
MQTAQQSRTQTSPASSTQRPSLFAITAAHSSVDMHTGSLAVLLPLLLSNLHLNYATAAAIITANNIVIAVAQPIFGALGDRKPNRMMIWFGCLLTGLAMASVLWWPSYLTVLGAVIVSGIGSAMFHPEALARARAVMSDKPATGVSVFFSGGNIGFALGPILATVLTQKLGRPGGLLMLIPTALALAGLASQWRVISGVRDDVRRTASTSSAANNYGLVAFLILLIAVRGTVGMGLQTFIPLFFHESGALRPEAAVRRDRHAGGWHAGGSVWTAHRDGKQFGDRVDDAVRVLAHGRAIARADDRRHGHVPERRVADYRGDDSRSHARQPGFGRRLIAGHDLRGARSGRRRIGRVR